MQKILIVDDDKTLRSLLQTLLELEGYEVILHESPSSEKEFLVFLETNHPGLILLDINLKFINGFDLFSKIRDKLKNKNIKTIMTSGMPLEDEAIEIGVDGFLMKPFMPDELLRLISKFEGN